MGSLVASGGGDKAVRLWSVDSRTPRGAPLTGHENKGESVSFSPDGRLLASGSLDQTVRLWHVASHRCLSVFTWFAAICSIAFQPRRIRLLGQTPALSDQHAVQQGQALLVIKQPQGRYELGFSQAETQGYAQKEIMDQTIITALMDITPETMNLPQHGALRQRLGALGADWGGGGQPQRLAMGDENGVVSFLGAVGGIIPRHRAGRSGGSENSTRSEG